MRRRVQRSVFKLGVWVGLILIGIGVGLWVRLPSFTQEQVREVIITTLQEEHPASFYVTGTLDIAATVHEAHTKSLWIPNLFMPLTGVQLGLGTTEVTLRVPGRVAYGFDVRTLQPEAIELAEDGVVDLTLPELTVFSVEPDLNRADLKTTVGWARLHARSGQEQELKALQQVQAALQAQAEAHLRQSMQPRVNTARAVALLLVPVLEGLGMEAPRFRVHVGPDLIWASPPHAPVTG